MVLRKIWWGKKADISDDVVRVSEIGAAPFALVVEYVEGSGNKYQLRMRIKLRDEAVLETIKKHGLLNTEVYIDRDAVAAKEYRRELAGEREAAQERLGLEYAFGSLHKYLALEAFAWWKEAQTVRITFATLLNGLSVRGDMNSCARLAREISMATDRLAAQLETARAFTGEQVRVFAPGARVKPGKASGVAPSKWRKG